jgi:hypothetical protein
MKGLSDTAPAAERVLIDAYRRMPLARKWRSVWDLFRTARVLHAAGLRLRNPAATDRDIHEDWLRRTLGRVSWQYQADSAMVLSGGELGVFQEVVSAFTRLGIASALGGSLASSVHGLTRQTFDADITVEPFPGKERELVALLGVDYYLDRRAVEDAVRQRCSFNIIHHHPGFKVGVFVRKDDLFEQSAMSRRLSVTLPDLPNQAVFLQTPEDVILFKLRWYRLGNEIAERQWHDILGVLKIQAGRLDEAYLNSWAAHLGVTDLLAHARQESMV